MKDPTQSPEWRHDALRSMVLASGRAVSSYLSSLSADIDYAEHYALDGKLYYLHPDAVLELGDWGQYCDRVRQLPDADFVLDEIARLLPEGWVVRIAVEQGCGTVALEAPDATTAWFPSDDRSLREQIIAAVIYAVSWERVHAATPPSVLPSHQEE